MPDIRPLGGLGHIPISRNRRAHCLFRHCSLDRRSFSLQGRFRNTRLTTCWRKILQHRRLDHARLARRRRRVAAAADEARHAGGDHCSDRRDVAVFDGGQRGRLWVPPSGASISTMSAALPTRKMPQCQAIDPGIVAGCRADAKLRRNVGEAGEMRDSVKHAERHDAAAGRRIGGYDQAIEGAKLFAPASRTAAWCAGCRRCRPAARCRSRE